MMTDHLANSWSPLLELAVAVGLFSITVLSSLARSIQPRIIFLVLVNFLLRGRINWRCWPPGDRVNKLLLQEIWIGGQAQSAGDPTLWSTGNAYRAWPSILLYLNLKAACRHCKSI